MKTADIQLGEVYALGSPQYVSGVGRVIRTEPHSRRWIGLGRSGSRVGFVPQPQRNGLSRGNWGIPFLVVSGGLLADRAELLSRFDLSWVASLEDFSRGIRCRIEGDQLVRVADDDERAVDVIFDVLLYLPQQIQRTWAEEVEDQARKRQQKLDRRQEKERAQQEAVAKQQQVLDLWASLGVRDLPVSYLHGTSTIAFQLDELIQALTQAADQSAALT